MNVQDRRVSPLMPVAEAARLLGCTPRTVHRHIEAGDIRAVRLGERGAWRVVRGGVEALIRAEPVTSRYGVREVEPLPSSSTLEDS